LELISKFQGAHLQRSSRAIIIFFLSFSLLSQWPNVALADSAGGALELYGGAAFANSSDLAFDDGTNQTANYDFGDLIIGGRLGGWKGVVGMALDATYFQRNSDIADISVVSISPFFMLRPPLNLFPSDAAPEGQFQPYFAIGPGFYFAAIDSSDSFSGNILDPDIGLDLRVGSAWQFHKYFALIGEYRLSHFGLDTHEVDTGLTTHHIIGGLSFRF
jgi:opacity protein-like surface antigen